MVRLKRSLTGDGGYNNVTQISESHSNCVVDHLIFDIKGWQLIVVVLFVAAVVVIGRRKSHEPQRLKPALFGPCVRHD